MKEIVSKKCAKCSYNQYGERRWNIVLQCKYFIEYYDRDKQEITCKGFKQ